MSRDDGTVQYELRNETDVPLEMLNMAEKERFMNGEKVCLRHIVLLCASLNFILVEHRHHL